MANVPVKQANAVTATAYLKATGAGSDADPYVPAHTIDAALPAGANNIGDMDVLSVVGDNVDMDSGVGTDNHAGFAWLLPGSGGHVVGGTGANPIRMDPVASTVQPVGVVSWFPGAGVVASVIGNPAVLASIAGVPGVLASIPNVANVAIQSVYVPFNAVASVIGNPAVIASIAGVPSVLASLPNIPSVSLASAYAPVTVIASIPNVPNMVASVIGNPAVIASVAGLPSVTVASFNVPVQPYTMGSQIGAVARVQASAYDAAPIAAPGANVYNYITQYSVINGAASYGGVVHLHDGTNTLHVGYAGPAGGGFAVHFPAARKPAANATVFVGVPVYSLDLYVTISGYQGA